MTNEQINIAIAEVCGWTSIRYNSIHGKWMGTQPQEDRDAYHLPNYCNDLNAMHEAEKFILKGFEDDAEGSELWQDYMVYVVCAAPAYLSHHATARQKAKAFLQTFGKWEERG